MDFIGNKTCLKLLKILLDNPLQQFNEIELINKAKTGKGSSSTAINNLIKNGILLHKRAGKSKLIYVNLSSQNTFLLKLLFDQEKLKNMPNSKLASLILLNNNIKEETNLVVVFGSSIAGTSTIKSDIDLISASKNIDQVELQRKKTEELLGERFNIHHYSKEELMRNFSKDYFLQNALFKGSIIQGFDFAKELFFNLIKNENYERLFFLHERIKSALRNYFNKDIIATKQILENTLEQLIFYLLSEKHISYKSKKDAKEIFMKLPESKFIKVADKSSIKKKIEIYEKFVIHILTKSVLESEGFA